MRYHENKYYRDLIIDYYLAIYYNDINLIGNDTEKVTDNVIGITPIKVNTRISKRKGRQVL